MKRILAIVLAAGIGLVGLGMLSAQDSEPAEPEHVPPQGTFETCWTESGAEIDCSQVEWPE